ncbi:deoxyuridine 5'-triphosphate protein [Enterococcus phage TJE2]|uniref:Deoxyuridine 5'-triphosphate protein n=1 Tax=Enterococcus phage TJE2 TaxID=2951263 RepID=A0A976SY27_9CAUD|nr:deoxyuridine 5'-triphosphate protein [Enterococcus phage TJE2]
MVKALQLAGTTFGKWYVKERDTSKKGRAYWICECSCGRTVQSIPSGTLTTGASVMCKQCANEKSLVGKTFGRLTVIKDSGERATNGSILWECKCSCGKTSLVRGSELIGGRTKSCGCYSTDVLKKVATKHGLSKVNGKPTKLFRAWASMKQRCYNKNHASYKDYGGRGITICSEWRENFEAFHDWAMTNGFSDDLSIDRIDNDKGYSPDNCRWVDAKTQIRNRRNTVTYEWQGKEYTRAELSRLTGINEQTIASRLNKGFSLEEVLFSKVGTSVLLMTYKGETKPVKQWCKELGLNYATVRNRHYKGWTDEEALTGIRNK